MVPLRGLSLQETAESMRDRVLREVGVPVTVGIARTKSLAKLVSDTVKPFGALALLDRDAVWALLDRLAPHGIETCLDLAFTDRLLGRNLLTITGEGLWWELNGEPVQPLHTRRPPHKTLSRGGSISKATADPHRVYAWTVRSLERLIEELEYLMVRPGRLSVWVAYKDGRARAGDGILTAPTDRFDLLLLAARQGLRQCWIPGVPVTRLHLVATDLRYPGEQQLGLFEPPPERAEAVARLKREVNAVVGDVTEAPNARYRHFPMGSIPNDEASQGI